jgi:hypothetical protein
MRFAAIELGDVPDAIHDPPPGRAANRSTA